MLGPQSQESRHISAVCESLGPAQREHGFRELTHAWDAGQPFYFWMALLGQLADVLIIVTDVLAQCVDLSP
jgi:hypothetical protein